VPTSKIPSASAVEINPTFEISFALATASALTAFSLAVASAFIAALLKVDSVCIAHCLAVVFAVTAA
jgi:hypothetical protein